MIIRKMVTNSDRPIFDSAIVNNQHNRRDFLKAIGGGLAATALPGCLSRPLGPPNNSSVKRPNILLAISDDQSWPHAGAYGCKFVETSAFDRIAREGILFTHAYCPSPSCSPSRASLLTGRNIWQNEEAGVHGSVLPKKFKVYTELLAEAGYHVGYTGKGWGPGNWQAGGRTADPVGRRYNKRKIAPPTKDAKDISENDYAGNFEDFLKDRKLGRPFCFWYGGTEPHRRYEEGSGLRAGKKLEDVEIPPFLPDVEVVRSDILDYAFEIEWFDRHLGRMLQILEQAEELDNTIIVVTSDNGMPFPRAKMQCYEFGTHIPLAIRWANTIKEGRTVDDLVSFIDLGPTFLDAAGLTPPMEMSGKSLMNILTSVKAGRVDLSRDRVLTGKERHSFARPDNMCYPIRAVRTYDYLYIRNLKPDRWPAGDPPYYIDMRRWMRYREPTAEYIIEHEHDEKVRKFFELSNAKRPTEELYAVEKDPGCLHNLAGDPNFAEIKKKLWAELEQHLIEQKDPRMLGKGDFFDAVPYFSEIPADPVTGKPLFPGNAELNRNSRLKNNLNPSRR